MDFATHSTLGADMTKADARSIRQGQSVIVAPKWSTDAPTRPRPPVARDACHTGTAADDLAAGALARGLSILELLVATQCSLTLTAISDALSIPLATCSALMKTLEQCGYASRQVVGKSHRWRPTMRMFNLGSQVMSQLDFVGVAQPILRRLADETGTSAHLGILEGPHVVYVAKAAAAGLVQFNTYPGKLAPVHVTALGRAIAASLPSDVVADLVRQIIANAPTQRLNPASFARELRSGRDQGFATDDGDEERGIACVAAPIPGPNGSAAASIGVTGLSSDIMAGRLSEISNHVVSAARDVASALGYVGARTKGGQ
jgi:DNA-binding IclR family transcriptional regulator